MDIRQHNKRHKRALSSIQYALVLQDQPEAWQGLEIVLRARLTPYERACLLTSVATANDTNLLIDVLETVVPARLAGATLPVFLDVVADAHWWAEIATLPELKAWLTACFLGLPEREKAEFLTVAKQRISA